MKTTFSESDANLLTRLAQGEEIEDALAEVFPGQNPLTILRSLVHRLQDILVNQLGDGLFAI